MYFYNYNPVVGDHEVPVETVQTAKSPGTRSVPSVLHRVLSVPVCFTRRRDPETAEPQRRGGRKGIRREGTARACLRGARYVPLTPIAGPHDTAGTCNAQNRFQPVFTCNSRGLQSPAVAARRQNKTA